MTESCISRGWLKTYAHPVFRRKRFGPSDEELAAIKTKTDGKKKSTKPQERAA